MTGAGEPLMLSIGGAPAGWQQPAAFKGLSGETALRSLQITLARIESTAESSLTQGSSQAVCPRHGAVSYIFGMILIGYWASALRLRAPWRPRCVRFVRALRPDYFFRRQGSHAQLR